MISDNLPKAVIWVMAFAVPLAIIPASYNSTLVKLLLFSVFSALILILLGLKMLKNPSMPENLPIHLLLALPAITALHVYAPSNPGVTRLLLVSSSIAVFVSLRTFQISIKQVLLPLLSGGTLAILVSLFLPTSSHRLAGLFGNANLLGSFAAALIPVGITFLWGKGWKKVLLLVLFAVICFTALLKSGTRSSIIALIAATAVVLCLKWRPKLFKLFVVLFLIVVAAMLFLPELSLPDMNGSPGVRQVIWEGSSGMFSHKPFFGWGNGSFQLQFPLFRPSDFAERGVSSNTVHAHSEPLEILAETGLVGFFLWSALIVILLGRAVRWTNKTPLEWGVITGVVILLLEGLTSVALRWTTSAFLLSILMSLLPVVKSNIKKLPRWSALLPLLAGLLLLIPGGYKVYRMTKSSIYLNSAMSILEKGESEETALRLCRESLRYNSWELGSWYTLGNIYGMEAATTDDIEESIDLIVDQLAAYDSLSSRASDFASMRINRIEVFLKLGMFDEAMDDVLYLYRHRKDVMDFCMDTGYAIIPLVSPDKAFRLMNLVFLDVLLEEEDTSGPFLRTNRMESSILTLYSIAAIYAPGALGEMKTTTDSMLTRYEYSEYNDLMERIDNEISLAEDGHSLLERYNTGDLEGIEDRCIEILFEEEAYAAYHRAVLCFLAADGENTELMEIVDDFAVLLAEPCSPLVSYYPGAGKVFLSATRLSIVAGRDDLQEKYFRFACQIDSYGRAVMDVTRNSYVNIPSLDVLEFWYLNGGPQASATLVSPTGLLVPEGETRRLLQLFGSESPEFKIAAHFLISSLASSTPGADTEYILTTAYLRLQSQKAVLAEIYGPDEAERIIITLLNRQIEYLGNGLFTLNATSAAIQLKALFESGL